MDHLFMKISSGVKLMCKTFELELGLTSQQEIVVVDKTTPKSLIFRINLVAAMDQ